MMETLPSGHGSSSFDAVIIGASVAGASTASLLARLGLRVLLLDRAEFPRDKVCGEGVMPAGVGLLEELFRRERKPPPSGFRFKGLRIWPAQPDGKGVELDFLPNREGMCFSRYSLDHSLVELAVEAGAVFRPGLKVTGVDIGTRESSSVTGVGRSGDTAVFRTPLIVAANGIRSRLHESAGIGITGTSERFGLRTTVPAFERDGDRVEIFCSRRGEAYVAPMDARARVTFLLNSRGLEGAPHGETRRDWLLTRFPRLARRCQGKGGLDATAPLARRLSGCATPGLVLVGDAASACDPVSGQGITLALRDAFLLEELCRQGLFDRPAELAQIYCERRQEYFAPAWELSENLLRIVNSPFLTRRFARLMTSSASFTHKVSSIATTGAAGTARIGWWEKLRLVTGL